MPKKKDDLVKHITVDAETGKQEEVWLPREAPAPEPPRKPSLEERLTALEKAFAAHVKGEEY